MPEYTNIILGEYFDDFIAEQIKEGRYSSASEVVQAALGLLEDYECEVASLKKLLEEGEASGKADYTYGSLMKELDNDLD